MKQHDTNQLRNAEMRLDALGRALAARLAEGAQELPHDVSERLRVARSQAVARRKVAVRRTAPAIVRAGASAALAAGDEGGGLWSRLVGAVPLVALAAGLLLINVIQNDNRDNELAEIDAALLTDDLPPAAYADPGFVQYLKWSRDHGQ